LRHESIVEARARSLEASMLEHGYRGPPVLVESSHYIILDGHHRYEALGRLGARLVPVAIIDYWEGPVRVSSWRPGVRVTREIIVDMAVRGMLFPPKTT